MPAPRLLDKRVVNTEVANQKRRDIDQGIALAKKVDAVRTSLGEEEVRAEKFRSGTIKRIQDEIDTKIAERDELENGNIRLRAERILAQAPIDLKEEWGKVREDRAALITWKESLGQQSIELLAKEEDNRSTSLLLEKEKEQVRREHELTLGNLAEAETERKQADEALERAEREAQRILQDAHQRENHLRVREEDATAREVSLSQREEEVQSHELDLSNREEKLRANQQIFIKAQAYIRSKK